MYVVNSLGGLEMSDMRSKFWDMVAMLAMVLGSWSSEWTIGEV